MELKDIIAIGVSGLSLLISTVSLVISSMISRLNIRNSVRPVIVFEYTPKGWRANNIGSGPALNAVVAQSNEGDWFNPVRVPALPKDGSIPLEWCLHDNRHGLGALYEDVNGRKYTTTCGNDLSHTRTGHLFGPWNETQIGRHWASGAVVPRPE